MRQHSQKVIVFSDFFDDVGPPYLNVFANFLEWMIGHRFWKGLGITSVMSPELSLPSPYRITVVPQFSEIFQNGPIRLLDGSRIEQTHDERISNKSSGMILSMSFDYPRSSPKSPRRLPAITRTCTKQSQKHVTISTKMSPNSCETTVVSSEQCFLENWKA